MAFPYLLTKLGLLRIEHLQLDETTTENLRRRGATNISELVTEVGKERYPTLEGLDAIKALDRLASVCSPGDVDWVTFWRGNDYRFHHRFLTCPELEEIDQANPVCAIGKVNFGNPGAMLCRAGVSTLGDLAQGLRDGLPEVPGMGSKKWTELFGRLVELVRDLRDGRISKDWLAKRYPIGDQVVPTAVDPMIAFNLDQSTRELHVGVLHLGTKASVLEANGVRTVGDAATSLPAMLSFSGVGRTTVSAVEARLRVLAQAQTSDKGIDWDGYCVSLDLPLLPGTGDPATGTEFVEGLGQAIAEIGDQLEDRVLKMVIERRLSKLPHQRATLEDIGTAEGVNLTRERVRQIESRFLSSLVAALLNDDYSNLDVHFRPNFADFWKAAADRFSGAEEVTHSALLDGLADVWNVDPTLLAQHLPFIVTVITGDVPTGRTLGDGARLGKDLVNMSGAVASVPVRKLQLGKSASTLEAHGLYTLGELVDAVRTGAVSRESGSHFRAAIDHLNHVSGSIKEGNGFDWGAYLKKTNTRILPLAPTNSPSEFLGILVPTIVALLELSPPTSRSPIIFARRTSHPVEARLSAEALAKELATYGPSIKREETELLRFLNAVLVEGNFAMARAHLRADFSTYWQEAVDCFDAANGDLGLFRQNLGTNWQLGSAAIEQALPSIVAVLTGYPYKRLGRFTKMAVAKPQEVSPLPIVGRNDQEMPARIVLRGFRRLH